MPYRHPPAWRARLFLAAMAAFAASRALAYAVPRDVQDPLIIGSLGGTLLPVYVAAWAVAALACCWDMRRPTLTGWGPALTIAMTCAWGAAWALGWVVSLVTGHPSLWWQTALTYLAPAVWTLALLMPATIARFPRHTRRVKGGRR